MGGVTVVVGNVAMPGPTLSVNMTTEYTRNLARLRAVDEEREKRDDWENGSGEQRSTLTRGATWLIGYVRCNMLRLVGLAISQVAGLLVRVDVPDHVVGQTNDLVAGTLGHFSEALSLGLVLERVGGEVDAYA